MTDHIIKAWNAQADAMNQWDALGEDEKLAWAYQRGMERAADICDAVAASWDAHHRVAGMAAKDCARLTRESKEKP